MIPILLVCFAAIALVLDRVWIDTAQVELSRATDAAALAAARELASDDLLRPTSTVANRIAAAQIAADQIAQMNRVAGRPLTFLPGDILFGKYVYNLNSGTDVFLESELDPWAVVVQGQLARDRNNPIPLIMSGFAGPASANLARLSIARLDNRLLALRASQLQTIPALPLTLFDTDPSGTRTDSWQFQIATRHGLDLWGIDPETRLPANFADGIPEIVLTLSNSTSTAASPNACLIDFLPTYTIDHVTQMITNGIISADLAGSQSQIDLTNPPSGLAFSTSISDSQIAPLQNLAGEPRIVFLSSLVGADSSNPLPQIAISGVVAGRIMVVSSVPGTGTQIVVQPTVLLTPTAETVIEVFDPATAAASTVPGNPYIYHVTIQQ